ncbi:MAG: CAP domain-containing protein [Chitinophagaceae bacterium]|nr:CAP domain-containing protein [Oligoflexus sp.]
MKQIYLMAPAFAFLITLNGCRSDVSRPGSHATASSSTLSSNAIASNGIAATEPRFTSCYKGDTWTCAVEAAIVKESNTLRSTSPLTQSFESSYVARTWSDSQAETGQISHLGFPEARQEVLVSAFPEANWDFLAENVAMLQSSDPDAKKIAKQFVTMWKNSPGHLMNIQGPFTYMGVGVSRIGNTFYATQLFH